VRFPSTHDITPKFLEDCMTKIRRLLAAGNYVIVCSKPRLDCIRRLCEEFADNKASVQFRFTIGARDDRILRWWEPGAPSFKERFDCLKLAFRKGFDVSANIEPMLDAPRVGTLCRTLAPYVNVFVNIGVMENIPRNVQRQTQEEQAKVRWIEENQTEDKIRAIYEDLKDERLKEGKRKGQKLVRWSPEIRKLLGIEDGKSCG
jgi:DNA repair photolyase